MRIAKLKELHSLGIEARSLLKKPEDEPRTNLRILPSGKMLVTFHSSCFSFISCDFNHITFPLDEIDKYIDLAKKELATLQDIWYYSQVTPRSLKSKPHAIPFVICVGKIRRIYWYHICREHRKDVNKYVPRCSCYITWQNLGED